MDINHLCPHCMREVKEQAENCPYCGKPLSMVNEVQHQLKPFTILAGKYIVGDVLGEGGFGITYIGVDINLEAPCRHQGILSERLCDERVKCHDGTDCICRAEYGYRLQVA